MTPDQIKAMVVTFLSTVPIERITPEVIRQSVTSFCAVSAGASGPDAAVIDAIARELEVKFEITMDNAAFIQLKFEPWMESKRATVDPYYWNRYRRFLSNTLPPRVLGTLEKDTDKIVGLLQNPLDPGPWKRRGLCVGHVQSGKTANYIGVIAKAADYGYKFVVLLAGLHNNLRHQTQDRLEEGFIGLDSAHTAVGRGHLESVTTGVGRIDSSKRPISITSKSSDFRTATANGMNLSFSAIHEPMVLVIKKQKKILENLTDWLRANNHSPGGVIRGVPMLVIDDEADNASVNTADGGDPTQINKLIRLLLKQFDQNCYVGYTATPFANIFIDPETEDAMLHEDLFPRDFIVALEPPANYVGPQRIFLPEGDLHGIIRGVADHGSYFPLTHKITHRVDELPPSLKEAIRAFVLVRAIRLLRGQKSDNSMLINVSRFNAVQQQVSSLVVDYLAELRNAVQNFAALRMHLALADTSVNALHETWKTDFSTAGFGWKVVQTVLNDALSPITVRTINNKSADALDYKAHEGGLNVIAVGGLSLSRGLTLEGLTISYFLRNSIMYDTLLQMGRWFGYRDGYADLCRLYMTSSAVSWYAHITNAVDELRSEFRMMEQQQRRPEDFGLKVRAHPDALIVTARNKMRTGRTIRHSVSLGGRLVETVAVPLAYVDHNIALFDSFVAILDGDISGGAAPQGVVWRGITASRIKVFLTGYRNDDDASLNTQTAPLIRLLDEQGDSILSHWDVCLFSAQDSVGRVSRRFGGRQVFAQRRSGETAGGAFLVSGESRRVASRGAEAAGLTDQQIATARAQFEAETEGKKKNVSDRFYRAQRIRPLLMLHLLDIDGGSNGNLVPAWGISFPSDLPETARVEYVVNTTWYREHFENDSVDEDDDDAEE